MVLIELFKIANPLNFAVLINHLSYFVLYYKGSFSFLDSPSHTVYVTVGYVHVCPIKVLLLFENSSWKVLCVPGQLIKVPAKIQEWVVVVQAMKFWAEGVNLIKNAAGCELFVVGKPVTTSWQYANESWAKYCVPLGLVEYGFVICC